MKKLFFASWVVILVFGLFCSCANTSLSKEEKEIIDMFDGMIRDMKLEYNAEKIYCEQLLKKLEEGESKKEIVALYSQKSDLSVEALEALTREQLRDLIQAQLASCDATAKQMEEMAEARKQELLAQVRAENEKN